MQMASLSKDKSGNRTIQFVAGDRKRRSIRLGKMPLKEANNIKTKVEALNAAAISQTSWDAETATWVGKLESLLYDKLANVGLLPKKKAGEKATLGPFLTTYIKGRSDVKPSTAINYRATQRSLLGYFGKNKPLEEITAEDGDKWRRWLAAGETLADGTVVRKKLGDNTIRRRSGFARQFFRAAVRDRLLPENPFGDMKGISVRSNRSRDYFVTREEAARVIEACPDAQWRLLFALSRYAGLRCPSEHVELRWSDIDWEAKRITIRSPKNERHEGQGVRIIPIFPELKQYLDDAWELVEEAVMALEPKERGKVKVITRYRDANTNLRTQLERIIARAGLKPWPKLFQNLRATRATELAAEYPAHVAAEWLGHSTVVAQKHYWRVTEADFEKAASHPTEALHNPVQSASVSGSKHPSGEPELAGICGKSEDFEGNQCSLMDSNHEPTD
jgi:integrase